MYICIYFIKIWDLIYLLCSLLLPYYYKIIKLFQVTLNANMECPNHIGTIGYPCFIFITFNFHMGFLCIRDLRISCCKKQWRPIKK